MGNLIELFVQFWVPVLLVMCRVSSFLLNWIERVFDRFSCFVCLQQNAFQSYVIAVWRQISLKTRLVIVFCVINQLLTMLNLTDFQNVSQGVN